MKNIVLLLILLSVYSVSKGQVTKNLILKALTSEMIPKNIKGSGKVIEADQWIDQKGENILIMSRFRPKPKPYPNNPGLTTESTHLLVNHYVKNGTDYNLVWNYQDSVIDCPFDLWIGPLENSTSITDLNSDNNTEITIVYSFTCRSDVSPSKMKVIMNDKDKLYTLKGTMYSNYIAGKLDKMTFDCNLKNVKDFNNHDPLQKLKLQIGRYENEDSFINSPKIFLDYCRNKWKDLMDKDQFKQLRGTDY